MDSKTNRAGVLAQQLGSERSWADTFAPRPRVQPTGPSSISLNNNSNNRETMFSKSRDAPPAYEEATGNPNAESHGLIPVDPVVDVGEEDQVPTVRSVSTTTDADNLPENVASIETSLDPSRSYVRNEYYGNITGTFTVLDHLELSIYKGTISIVLDPRPGDGTIVVKLTATYGAIKVYLSDAYMRQLSENKQLERPWDVTIRAKHGAVTSQLPIGNGSKFFIKSRHGAITSTFLAAGCGPGDTLSEIKTETHKGAQEISIKSLQGDKPVTAIAANYHAKAKGSLDINYPPTWEGKIEASSNCGKAKIKGPKLDLHPYGKREIHGQRGDSSNLTVLKCDSCGKARIQC